MIAKCVDQAVARAGAGRGGQQRRSNGPVARHDALSGHGSYLTCNISHPASQAQPRQYVLGQRRQVNGQPLTFSRKAQKKPLELLKALIALGGERVEISTLTGLLWPDAEGDSGKASFDSTLYRLRKLLGLADLLTVSEGRLSIEPARSWVDVRKLDELVVEIENEGRTVGG